MYLSKLWQLSDKARRWESWKPRQEDLLYLLWQQGGMLWLAPFRCKSPVLRFWQRERGWGPKLLVLFCAATQPSPHCSPALHLSLPPYLPLFPLLLNIWRKGKIAELCNSYWNRQIIHSWLKKQRVREANLCLSVSQVLRSWIPAWISCYFSPEFTLKKKKHSLLFFA